MGGCQGTRRNVRSRPPAETRYSGREQASVANGPRARGKRAKLPARRCPTRLASGFTIRSARLLDRMVQNYNIRSSTNCIGLSTEFGQEEYDKHAQLLRLGRGRESVIDIHDSRRISRQSRPAAPSAASSIALEVERCWVVLHTAGSRNRRRAKRSCTGFSHLVGVPSDLLKRWRATLEARRRVPFGSRTPRRRASRGDAVGLPPVF